MPATAIGSRWVAGALKFFRKSDSVVLYSVGTPSVGRALTRVDKDEQNTTLLAEDILAGFLVHSSETGGGTLTCDTGANLSSAFPEWQIGETMECRYLNDGDQTVTLTGATGTTRLSAQTILTLQGRRIVFLKTGAATYDVWAD